MIFIWKKKKEKRMQGSLLTMLQLYSLTLGLTLILGACPKALASPTLYSLLQFKLWAAFQPCYAAGFPQLAVAACTGRVPGVGKGVPWSQHAPPGTAWGQSCPCCWARLPEGSGDAEGGCGFPGGPFASRSHRPPGHRQQLGHDHV